MRLVPHPAEVLGLMRHTGKAFNYAETHDLQILEMPYAGGGMTALVLLPKNVDLGRIENLLTLENLDQWSSFAAENANRFIPPKVQI